MNALIFHQFLCFHEMEYIRRQKAKTELRRKDINVQVNRTGIFVYWFAFARFLTSCVILGDSHSFSGAFSILKNQILMCLPVLAQIHHSVCHSKSLSWDPSHWLDEFLHTQGLIHNIRACINVNNLVSLWKVMRVQMDFSGPIWAFHPVNQISHI